MDLHNILYQKISHVFFFNFSSFKTYTASEILILNIENNGTPLKKKFNELKNRINIEKIAIIENTKFFIIN